MPITRLFSEKSLTKVILKTAGFVLFIIAILFLHIISVIGEIQKNSPVWYIALNLVIPAMAIIAIVLYGFNYRPLKYRWVWKTVPILYALLLLWDLFSHISLIRFMVQGHRFSIIPVLVRLAIQALAVYFSSHLGYSAFQAQQQKIPDIEPKSSRLLSVIATVLFVVCVLSVAFKWMIIIRGFIRVSFENGIPFIFTQFFHFAPLIMVMPWLYGLAICFLGAAYGAAYRYNRMLMIPNFILLLAFLANMIVFYSYQGFWITSAYY
jgi:hypothetical protein